MKAFRRGDIAIYLTSPHGTKSQLLTKRPYDNSRAGFQDWPFLTVFCWGENPTGTWWLEIQNGGRYEALLTAWSITFHGTSEDPDKVALPQSQPQPTPPPSSPPVAAPVKPTPQPAAPHSNQFAPQANQFAPQTNQFAQSQPYQAAPSQPKQPQPQPASVQLTIEHCVYQSNPDYCQACQVGYKTLAGRCVKQCPQEGFYEVFKT